MHARKTRQRKKEHMQKLQNRADELKLEQIRLKQAINEKNTASILVGLFQKSSDGGVDDATNVATDPKVEILLKRTVEDIPDAAKIPELPALLLPGQQTGKKRKSSGGNDSDGDNSNTKNAPTELQEDGIDYKLLGKDRSSCTPAELDQIRRERNRMHAKRTRDRKRIFMEEMEVMIKKMEEENSLLTEHANKLNVYVPPPSSPAVTGSMVEEDELHAQPITPDLAPMSAPFPSLGPSTNCTTSSLPDQRSCYGNSNVASKGDFVNQIESLLAAAGTFQKRGVVICENNAQLSYAESDVTASMEHSDHNSFEDEEEEDDNMLRSSRPKKRQCLSSSLDLPTSVPKSITTTNYLS